MALLCLVNLFVSLLIDHFLRFDGAMICRPFFYARSHFTDPVRALQDGGCYLTISSDISFLAWLPALLFEPFLCLLMLNKAWRLYRDETASPLLNLLIRDRCVPWRHSRASQL
jgi:hypothetical protein